MAGEVLRARVIAIRGELIESVGPDKGRYPDDARVIDLFAHTVAPASATPATP